MVTYLTSFHFGTCQNLVMWAHLAAREAGRHMEMCVERLGGIVWVSHMRDLIQAHRWKLTEWEFEFELKHQHLFLYDALPNIFVRKIYFKNSWNDGCQHQFENIDDFAFIAKKPDTCEILSFNPLRCLVFSLMETVSRFCNSIWWDFLIHTFGAPSWLSLTATTLSCSSVLGGLES